MTYLPGRIRGLSVVRIYSAAPDLHVHLRGQEQVLIDVLADTDLQGERQED